MGTLNFSVITITFVLFAAALFVKGFTHDLLLETAVFLVSVKVILATHHTNKHAEEIKEILNTLVNRENDQQE